MWTELSVTNLETWFLGELVPDVEPLAVLTVDALTTNLNLNVVDQNVANPVEPTELVTRTIQFNSWKSHLQVDSVDKVTISADCAGHLLSEVGRTVECLLD